MKKYLIIGGSTGMGRAITEQLASSGHQVIATYNQTSSENNDNITYLPLDVTSDFETDFIPDDLDGLVYCPGSINLAPFNRIKPEDFTADYNLQVVGAVKIIQAALPALKKSSNASVVLFSTVAMQSGFNFHSQVSASKGAIEGLTRALAAEFAPTVRFNAIAPALTDTPLAAKFLDNDAKREAMGSKYPLKRLGTAQDMANAALFLLSEQSSWMTGEILHVDGGMTAIKG